MDAQNFNRLLASVPDLSGEQLRRLVVEIGIATATHTAANRDGDVIKYCAFRLATIKLREAATALDMAN